MNRKITKATRDTPNDGRVSANDNEESGKRLDEKYGSANGEIWQTIGKETRISQRENMANDQSMNETDQPTRKYGR